MLNILGMIILIIILFIIILLLIGIKISFIYDKKGSQLKGCLKILIFKKIKVYSHTFPSKDDDDEEEEEEENDEEKKQRDVKKILNLAKPCFEDFKIFVKSSLNVIKVKRLDNHLIFGMDSYADTGKYIGIIWAILATINPLHEKLHLSAEPSFAGSVLDINGVNEVEIHVLKLIVPTIRLVSKKDVRIFIRGVLDER
ncbi:DUF2953 domain-containing protein [Methanobrevibacter sp.]|uniref:DUF2953 domain-containing protein n=1 Tax=Methanobrevibacter sp. TaxID=66852 RepID=UPI0026DFBE56|nr:DUF2953 domain-containing protein [Methanobrevibacter sp.]MDO5859547.1 DUF2953 domain-containing protein [Methanobrevibacter sp.]